MKKHSKVFSIAITLIVCISLTINFIYAKDNGKAINNDNKGIVIDDNIINQDISQNINDLLVNNTDSSTNENLEISDTNPSNDNISDYSSLDKDEKKQIRKELKEEIKEEKNNIKELNKYLKSLDSKNLSKEIRKVTKRELHSYLKEIKGYTDLQIQGKTPIINENGNLFIYSDYSLCPYLPTPSEINELKSNRKSENQMPMDVDTQIDENLEIPFMRDDYTKHYKMENGSYKAVISPTPVHYIEDNEYKDINVIIRNNNSGSFEYSNLENSFKTYFNSSDSLDDNIISKYVKLNEDGIERKLEFMIENANPSHETLKENKIKYHNIFPNVDIEYQINPVRLKENIYVNEPVTSIDYEFLLKLDGVTPRVTDALDIEFVDDDTNEIIWVMERPYAEDSGINQLITKDMHYDIKHVQVNGEDLIKLILVMDDPNFLTDATYPIVIDPTILPSMSNIRMIITDSNKGFGYENEYHMYGFPNGSRQEHRVYMNFDLSSMPTSSVVNTAQLQITPLAGLGNNLESYYTCRRLTSSFSSATWYNQPSVTTKNEARWLSKDYEDPKFFFIDDLLNDAIKDGQFYGVEIKGDRNKSTGFYTDVHNKPQLFIDYRVDTVPEIYFSSLKDYQVIKKGVTKYAAQIAIRDDASSDELTTDLYVNGVKKDTKTGAAPVFLVDYTNIPDGICTIKFVSSDGVYSTEKVVLVKVDRNSPTINDVQVDTTETSIDVTVSATDPTYSLPSIPYSFGIDGNMTSYQSDNNMTFSGLQPSSTYTIDINVQDESNQITEASRTVTTKAQIPIINATDIKSNEITVNISDDNNFQTQYLIRLDDQYVTSDGTLSSSPEWLSFQSDKSIIISSLDIGKAHDIKAKAKNIDNEETVFSDVVTVSTIGEIPAVIQNLSYNVVGNSITWNWDSLVDASKYDIDINGDISQVTGNEYILNDATLDINYKVRVRGINDNGNGEWSDYIEFIPSENINIQTIAGEDYYLTWYAEEKTSLNNNNYILLYDPKEFEVVDLCAATYGKEKTVGKITGSIYPITIEQVEPGKIKFSIDKNDYNSKLYTAPFNTIILKALKSQQSVVQFKSPIISTTP